MTPYLRRLSWKNLMEKLYAIIGRNKINDKNNNYTDSPM